MQNYFVDLHVHIGRAGNGTPVKITAAKSLTVANILEECRTRKGIDMVGIVDASSPGVQDDLERLIDAGVLNPMEGGGQRFKDSVTLILGGEIETTERVAGEKGDLRDRAAHCLCYFPHLADIKAFTKIISGPGRVKNPNLSSQKCRLSMQDLWEIIDALGGILIPAHAFTPHKGVYGSCVGSMLQILTPKAWAAIPAVELGLSSDSDYADLITELAEKTFLSNSDAHSLPKIGREYNLILMEEPTFDELIMALRRQNGRAVTGNYGFDPRLGKYHRTYCEECMVIAGDEPPVVACTVCGAIVDGRRVVKGVLDRIYQIKDSDSPRPPEHRPGYRHQIPLENLPGIGRKTLEKLLAARTEMEVLHLMSEDELRETAGSQVAEIIILARAGRLAVSAGGGGHYGRVTGKKGDNDE